MIKKWPIRLYEDDRIGIIDLSLITRLSCVSWHEEDKTYVYHVHSDAIVNISKTDFITPLKTMACKDTDKTKLIEARSKMRDALIEYHTQIGMCRDILPEEDDRTIDPISTIDLTQNMGSP